MHELEQAPGKTSPVDGVSTDRGGAREPSPDGRAKAAVSPVGVLREAGEALEGSCLLFVRHGDLVVLEGLCAMHGTTEESLRRLVGSGPWAVDELELPAIEAARLIFTLLPAGDLGYLGLVTTPGQSLDLRSASRFADELGLVLDNERLARVAADAIALGEAAELARRRDETTMSRVARSAPIMLFACDGEGAVTYMEGGLLAQFQVRGDSFVGRPFLDIFSDYTLIAEYARRVLDGEAIRRAQLSFQGRNLEAWAQPLRSADGTVTGFAGVVVDVSAKVAAEVAVLDAARRQAALVEHASDVILVLTADGTIHYVNPACRRVLGYGWHAGDMIDVLSLVHPDDRDICRESIRQAFSQSGVQPPVSYRIAHADGSWRHIESIGNNLLDDPAISGFVVTLRDVTDQRLTEERVIANTGRQAALASLGRWALASLDYVTLVEDAVAVLAEQLGAELVHVFESYADASFLTLTASRGHVVSGSELMSSDPTSSPASFALVTGELVISEDLSSEDRFDVPDLWSRAAGVSVVEVPIPGDDMPAGVLGVGSRRPRHWPDEDLNFLRAVANVLAGAAARRRAEREIRAQALRDPLTGLANRLRIVDQSASTIVPRRRTPQLVGLGRTVFVLDVDRFKEINDTLGHAIGDVVLIEIANRLERIGEPVELVARLGGDEFAVVARDLPLGDEEVLAYRLLSVLGEPLDVGGVKLRLRGAVGISGVQEEDVEEIELSTLLRQAETAMFQAKSDHAGARRYVDALERSSLSRLALASELADAVEHGQLRLDYQPKMSIRDGSLTGVEALVRWQHPTRGLLLPDVFVPLAEQTGIVRELTNWVLARALAECASWHRAGWQIPVAVNLSAGTVHDPSLLDTVMGAIARAGLTTADVELEITESAVMLDPDGALRTLEELTSRGVKFAIDDFGTGYSSLTYLQKLPVSSVKVDKSFVIPLPNDGVARAIVRAVVDLGHSLELSVIAEGVDSADVLRVVTELGCDELQGFFMARPMGARELATWLAGHADPAPRLGAD